MTFPVLNRDLSNKVAIVTGATSGIGKEIARGLARMGATVVIGARDAKRAEATLAELGYPRVVAMTLDVSSVASIQAFAAQFKAKYQRLDILVNNAGSWMSSRRTSPDGTELTFATNVVGPYALTLALEDSLAASAPARVVNIVSGLAANYDASDLNFKTRSFNGFKAYAQSKQALRMLTWSFADRLAAKKITVNAIAPGFVKTAFNRDASGFVASLINLSANLFALTPAQGADTPLWACIAPELENVTGKYFEKRSEKDGKFRDAAPRAELWAAVEKMAEPPHAH